MKEFIQEAGWGILPVLLVGGISVLLALVFAVTVRRETLPMLAFFWMTTLLTGTLGSLSGVRETLRAALGAQPDKFARIIAGGLLESSNCLQAALMIAISAALVAGVGGFRLLWRSANAS